MPPGCSRRSPPGEPRDGQVGRAPEVVHRTALAGEPRAEHFQHAVGLHQDPPEPVGVLTIVGAMDLVAIERDRIRHLVRALPNVHVQAERVELVHEARVERRDRLRLEREPAFSAVARRDDQPVIDEVEIDLERAGPVRHGRGGQAARGHVQRGVPGVVHPRALGEADLADDLRPAVQRLTRVLPGLERQRGPHLGRRGSGRHGRLPPQRGVWVVPGNRLSVRIPQAGAARIIPSPDAAASHSDSTSRPWPDGYR